MDSVKGGAAYGLQGLFSARRGLGEAIRVARRTPGLAFLAAAVVAYNSLMGLVPESVRDVIYVPVNLAFFGVLAAGFIPWFRLTPAELGLAPRGFRKSATLGLVIGVLVPLPVFLMVIVPGLGTEDTTASRFADASVGEFIYQTAVRIPLGTALFEEMLFRGLLYGALLRFSGHRSAILGSSAVFGLWHVRPTHEMLSESGTLSADWAIGLAIAGAVVVTFVGGLLFGWLRYKTGHVAGGVVAHALINSLSATAAYAAV